MHELAQFHLAVVQGATVGDGRVEGLGLRQAARLAGQLALGREIHRQRRMGGALQARQRGAGLLDAGFQLTGQRAGAQCLGEVGRAGGSFGLPKQHEAVALVVRRAQALHPGVDGLSVDLDAGGHLQRGLVAVDVVIGEVQRRRARGRELRQRPRQQHRQRVQHRGLAHAVDAGDQRHIGLEGDVELLEAATVREGEGLQFHPVISSSRIWPVTAAVISAARRS
jgi:hypothetical protein